MNAPFDRDALLAGRMRPVPSAWPDLDIDGRRLSIMPPLDRLLRAGCSDPLTPGCGGYMNRR